MKTFIIVALLAATSVCGEELDWPAVTNEARPWTRWWWLGSGVDEANLTKQLAAFQKAGLGGVEICPIYGAKGYEDRDLQFLSKPWTDAYSHTVYEAGKKGMGVDLTTGTGWPFGGPMVETRMASASLEQIVSRVKGGEQLSIKLPEGQLIAITAWPENGVAIDLSDQVDHGSLKWKAPAGNWTIRGLVSKHGIQKVKRAAPGGAGWVLDPFSESSIESYFNSFDVALDRPDVPEPRSHFHDSFEYYGAAWTDGFLEKFRRLRGYDLRSQLPAFQGAGDSDIVARVRADYRETMSDLHRAYLARWHEWAKSRGSLTRNQAHGSPGNLLDHYAVADIPETEIFRHVDEAQIPMLQFASSAAHITGKKLISAETFTWLGEHFQVTPQELKEAADFVWLGGVNHILFHGIPYTPDDAGWPGWLFYASTHMGPNGGLWENLPAFNTYIARVQSFLQSGKPDPDVLLYFPIHDIWHDGRDGLPLFTMHNQEEWLQPMPFYKTAMKLWESGLSCDFVSDHLLESLQVKDGKIIAGEVSYPFLLIPESRYLSEKAIAEFLRLKEDGATVIRIGQDNPKVPGFYNFASRRQEIAFDLAKIPSTAAATSTSEIPRDAPVQAESDLARLGIRYVRRVIDGGRFYFLVNSSGRRIDAKVKLSRAAKSTAFLDPWTGRRGMVADTGGIRLILESGESRIVRLFTDATPEGAAWSDPQPSGIPVRLTRKWSVRFLTGGPKLPEAYTTNELESWTACPGKDYRNFSGTARYRIAFDVEKKSPTLLDLGEIAHTAKVRLNGEVVGTCWVPPHRFDVSRFLRDGENILEVDVTNLAANRIADLDRQKVPWKSFHEINFVNIDYEPFDASDWEPLPSGLLGPVRLIPFE